MLGKTKHSKSSSQVLASERKVRRTLDVIRNFRMGVVKVTLACVTRNGMTALPALPHGMLVAGLPIEVVASRGTLSFDGVCPHMLQHQSRAELTTTLATAGHAYQNSDPNATLMLHHGLHLHHCFKARPWASTWRDSDGDGVAMMRATPVAETGLRVLYFEGYPVKDTAEWEMLDPKRC